MPDIQKAQAEAKQVLEMFSQAADGNGSVKSALDEINRDRETFRNDPQSFNIMLETVRKGLHDEKLLPRLSVIYAKENMNLMGNDNDQISDRSFWLYRKAQYRDMNVVEKSIVHTLMSKFAFLKHAASDPEREDNKVDRKDLDTALKLFREGRQRAIEHQEKQERERQQQEYEKQAAQHLITSLLKDNGSLFTRLWDYKRGGITLESLTAAETTDNNNPRYLSGAERQTSYRVRQMFKELSNNDQLITQEDLKLYGSRYGIKI
ncbi:MAG TPA: hypothetical protein V6D17_01375 [Candidatus Obscuribacterales bacterium]